MTTQSQTSIESSSPKLTLSEFKKHSSQLFTLGYPILLGQITQMSMSFVDVVVAGRAGQVEMAGVAVASSFWFPLLLFGQGLLNPIAPLVAQVTGAQKESPDPLFRQGLWLALFISMLLMSILYIASHVILTVESIEPALSRVASEYLQYILWGLPAFMAFFVCRFNLEGRGLTRPTMITGIVALLLNIPLNIIFVLGYFGFPALGGAGCGLASAIVCWVMFATMLYFTGKYSRLALQFETIKTKVFLKILRLGVPSAFANMLEVSAFSLIALLIAPLGSMVVAAHQAVMTTSSLVFMVPLSIGVATSIRVGTFLGGEQKEQAILARRTASYISLVVGVISLSCVVLFRYQIAGLYTQESEVIALAVSIMILMGIYQIPDNFQLICLAALRGYNDTKAIFYIASFCYWAIALPLGYLLCFTDTFTEEKIGVHGFWISLIVGLSFASFLFYKRLRHLEHYDMEKIKNKIEA